MHLGPAPSHNQKSHLLHGTGSFENCLRSTSSLLNKDAPCPDAPCLFNGVHVPPIDFSVSHFIGVSEYWYSSEHVFGLGGPYDFVQYERAASQFCAREWPSLVKEHQEFGQNGRLGGACVCQGYHQTIFIDKIELTCRITQVIQRHRPRPLGELGINGFKLPSSSSTFVWTIHPNVILDDSNYTS
jgi:Golgi nucleoside diphosphatase